MEDRLKYPRTPHLPWSPGATEDDRIMQNANLFFFEQEVVVTEKMDGECSTISREYTHARSVTSCNHPSRHWLKTFHGGMAHNIPENFRICGENMYAEHSLSYNDLESYFLVFSIWEKNRCLDWDTTLEYAELLGLTMVPVLWRGIWSEKKVRSIIDGLDLEKQEGVVVRRIQSFLHCDFGANLAKWVRKDHVQTDEHWMSKPVIPNKLRGM